MSQVKLFDPFTRVPGTSLADFSRHWTGVHAEIAKGIPQIKHYVQSHRHEARPPALGAPLGDWPVDGSSETWYDEPSEVLAMIDEPAAQALLVDEANFMDLQFPRHPVMTRERHVDGERPDPGAPSVKLLLFARRHPDADREAFLDAWITDDDARLGQALGASHHVVCPRVEDFAFPNADVPLDDEVQFDGVRELWFPSHEALQAGAEADPGSWARLVHPPAVDAPRSFALFAYERVIIP